MTLSNLWPGFQGNDIFEVKYQKKNRHVLKTKLLLHKMKVYLTYFILFYLFFLCV